MISLTHRFVSAGLLATAAFAAAAQAPVTPVATPSAGTVAERGHYRPHDGKFFERMQERRTKQLTELKAKLRLDPAQEGAWSAFTAATQPPARPADRATARAEFEKMTTPQRLDRMQARQAERTARFAARADATRSFYATLSPEQQKTFDAESLPLGPRGGHGHPGHRTPPAPAKG